MKTCNGCIHESTKSGGWSSSLPHPCNGCERITAIEDKYQPKPTQAQYCCCYESGKLNQLCPIHNKPPQECKHEWIVRAFGSNIYECRICGGQKREEFKSIPKPKTEKIEPLSEANFCCNNPDSVSQMIIVQKINELITKWQPRMEK